MTHYSLTAVVQDEDGEYVALCPEFDIASQGKTVEEAKANLREAVDLFLECASASEIAERFHPEVLIERFEAVRG
jgi:predicted RNase H-like HicB family nuclease